MNSLQALLDQAKPKLSGKRISATYHLTGTAKEAQAKAKDICVEQTVEFPEDLIPEGPLRAQVMGQVESLRQLNVDRHEAVITYAVETTTTELPQLLNVLYGNISMKPGIKLDDVQFPPNLLKSFKGPRYGSSGIRALLKITNRPLLATALKPMGLSSKQMAELAYLYASGGMDLIKDDHGLANQPMSPFEERVENCARSVQRANKETGRQALYIANITGPTDLLIKRAIFAKQAGAGGLMISPGISGWDAVRMLSEDDRIELPILTHPTALGSYVTSPENGISYGLLFGLLPRLAGADVTIFSSFGGRFPFSRQDCEGVLKHSQEKLGGLKTTLPMAGGGMSLERVEEQREFYGKEVAFLIGGNLHRIGPEVTANCQRFLQSVE